MSAPAGVGRPRAVDPRRVHQLLAEGASVASVARLLRVDRATVRRARAVSPTLTPDEGPRYEFRPPGPIARYHGGKWRDGGFIIQHMPPAHLVDIYGEPYCGMGSVFLQKPRHQTEILNDLDGEVVNVFRVLQDPVLSARLETRLRATPYSRAEYVRARRLAGCGDSVARAWSFIVRSYMGFGSDSASGGDTGFRSGVRKASIARSTGSKAPVGSEWRKYPDRIAAFRERLAGVHLECERAINVIKRYESPRTLFYLDPTYLKETRSARSFRKGKGYKLEMSRDDHIQLADVAHASPAMILISGYASRLYDHELYAGWHRVTKRTFADAAQAREEVLWINPAAAAALNDAA